MKRMLVGAIIAGAILSSGCATITNAALANRGARSGAGGVMTFQKGPTYGMGAAAQDHHSLADVFGRRPSPGGPLGMATPLPVLEPGDSPLVEWGALGLGVKGFPAADFRRLGLSGYAKSWAESGLGRSFADISNDPSPIYIYLQLRVLPGGGRGMLLY